MNNVLFVGESWSVTSTHTKGFDSFTTTEYAEGGAALLDALDTSDFDVTYMPCHVAAKSFPATREALDEFDVVLFSDIGSNTLLLPAPTFLKGQQTPNRLDLIRDWVADGGGFGMIGGYMSFQGIEAKANYRSTSIADILPVEMEIGDDRVEAPQGVVAMATRSASESPSSAIIAGLEDSWPPLLGYQKFSARAGSTVVAAFDSDPLIVTGAYGSGRTMAYASDIGEHWAPKEFTEWSGFGEIWRRSAGWLAGA